MTSGMDAVRRELRNIDPTLTAAAESTLGKALFPIEGLRDKTNKTLRRREDLRTDRLRRARAALYPNGHLQERTLGLVSLFARQGTGVIGRIRERMDPWAAAHTALYL
jgi:hypothetical protein